MYGVRLSSKKSRFIHRYYIFIVLSLCVSQGAFALPPINWFRPSDRFLMPEPPAIPCWTSQFSWATEVSTHIKGFLDDDNDCFKLCGQKINELDKKVDVLHIYGNVQNVLAALKGFSSLTPEGQLGQQFNINDENGTQGLFRPCGKMDFVNQLFSYRLYFDYGLNLAFHLPYIRLKLHDVRWCRTGNPLVGEDVTAEQVLASEVFQGNEKECVNRLKNISGINLGSWKRDGVGDLVTQLTWMRDFPQCKPLLSNVRVQTRFGVIFPTGRVSDPDILLGIPFGTDGAWGVQFAGGLDLTFYYSLRAGIDAEFVHQFGHIRPRRIRTACNETDLLFTRKVPAYREYGLGQQYNLYVESFHCWRGLSIKGNYQFLKRNDDRIDICNDRIDANIVNSAESLQDWTAHSFILGIKYDFCHDIPNARFVPTLGGWYKWGFNGKRALLADTFGIQLTVDF